MGIPSPYPRSLELSHNVTQASPWLRDNASKMSQAGRALKCVGTYMHVLFFISGINIWRLHHWIDVYPGKTLTYLHLRVMCTSCTTAATCSGYLAAFFPASVCVHEHFLTSWFIGLHKHHANPNRMWTNPLFFFYLRATLFRPLMPLIEVCRGLWGQHIHCNEGATS